MAAKKSESSTTPTAPAEPTRGVSSEQLRTRRASALTLQTLSIKDIEEGQSIFVRLDSEIATKEQTDDDGKVKMEKGKPLVMHTVNATDIETGEVGSMVLPFIVHKSLVEFGDYVGKEFEFKKGAKRNRTNEWCVWVLN